MKNQCCPPRIFFPHVFKVQISLENLIGMSQILVKILCVGKYSPKTVKKGQIWGKMLEIFTNMPKKVILCQNPVLAKYAKICSTELGSFHSEFSELQKKY